MTELQDVAAGAGVGVDSAVEAADAAARLAAVSIREIADLAELNAVYQLYDGIWQPDPTNPPVTTDLLRAFTKAGNYVAGAFDDGRLVGACMGFFGPPASRTVYSHIAGVSPAVRGRGVGFALELHQRAWAQLHGIAVISWTFDPLVSRNAYFNIAKLAARPVEYLPNFYGDMRDAINRGEESDRLLMRWRLDAAEVDAACTGAAPVADVTAASVGAVATALSVSPAGLPVVGSLDAPTLLVAVPADIEALRATDPLRAKEWRVALRSALGGLIAGGARVTGFDRDGWYVVATGNEARSRL